MYENGKSLWGYSVNILFILLVIWLVKSYFSNEVDVKETYLQEIVEELKTLNEKIESIESNISSINLDVSSIQLDVSSIESDVFSIKLNSIN
ncbi:MAG: hypothetical protein M1114_02700 [Candidatus Dependentiae bacterium]|nr:hypothetical protein [Candidatus Dependentiae bacterium]